MQSRLSEITKRVSLLAPGKRVMILSSGASIALPAAPPKEDPPKPDPIAVLAKKLEARDILLIEANEQFGRQIDDVLLGVKETATQVAEGQERVLEGVQLKTKI